MWKEQGVSWCLIRHANTAECQPAGTGLIGCSLKWSCLLITPVSGNSHPTGCFSNSATFYSHSYFIVLFLLQPIIFLFMSLFTSFLNYLWLSRSISFRKSWAKPISVRFKGIKTTGALPEIWILGFKIRTWDFKRSVGPSFSGRRFASSGAHPLSKVSYTYITLVMCVYVFIYMSWW